MTCTGQSRGRGERNSAEQAHLAEHHDLLVGLVSHGMHHGIQQLDWGVKIVVLAVLTAQVRDAHLHVHEPLLMRHRHSCGVWVAEKGCQGLTVREGVCR